MKRYTAIEVEKISEEESDILVALLSEIGYEGFEQSNNAFKAYINEMDFSKEDLEAIAQQQQVTFTSSIIEEQNWNQVWESNFEPIRVDNFVGIRADFHPTVQGVEHEIIITPKMSFGTGHHATTYMMVQQMRNLPLQGATVFDFGTGTGILSILAEKLGAKEIIAIDNDEWSIRNTEENLKANDCSKVQLQLADAALHDVKFDIVLANINKNIITGNFDTLVSELHPKSYLLLSGLLSTDENDIAALAQKAQLTHINTLHNKQWISILYQL